MSSWPQAFSISFTLSPLGETSRTERLSGTVWPTRWSVTSTSEIGPTKPLTAISDGYGAAYGSVNWAPGILMGVGFEKNDAAEADALTASEASTKRTDSRISLRRLGNRATLPIRVPCSKTVLIICAPLQDRLLTTVRFSATWEAERKMPLNLTSAGYCHHEECSSR